MPKNITPASPLDARHTPDSCPWCEEWGYEQTDPPRLWDRKPLLAWYVCPREHLYSVWREDETQHG